MTRSLSATLAVLSSCAVCLTVCLTAARVAHAAPPGNWSLGVERLFGISRVTNEAELDDNTTISTTATSISLFSPVASGLRGYSSPRLAFDYLASSGVTFGGAFGYESINDPEQSAWVLAARLGYFARPTAGFGVWPRGGLTHIGIDFDPDDDDDLTLTALTLEVPLVFLVLGHSVGLTVMPHADIGIAGGTDTFDRKVTEIGLQFGMNAFF